MYDVITELTEPMRLLHLGMLFATLSLWRVRAARGWRLALATTFLLLLTVLSTPIAADLAMWSLEKHYPPTDSRPADVQAIVVLASDTLQSLDNRLPGELGASSLHRCHAGARLYRNGPRCPVVLTGWEHPAPEIVARYMKQLGVAEPDLIFESESLTTYESAVRCWKMLEPKGMTKIALVSSSSHLLRSEKCFRRQGFYVVACGCEYRSRFNWRWSSVLPSAHAASRVQEAMHEWVGLAWYWMRGKT